MPCYAIDGVIPVVHADAYVHPQAVLIGEVNIGPGCYIAPLASLRGDCGPLIVEAGSNIQDGCVMHGYSGMETRVKAGAQIGHGAVLHSCIVGAGALVGINCTVLDGAVIGDEALVAAHSLVKGGASIPARHLAAGAPAKVLRPLSSDECTWLGEGGAQYRELTRRSIASMTPVAPLPEPQANRPRLPVSESRPKQSRGPQQ
ncbi:MAG: phenylacetic acid degradation protein PaaY [Gammaproteobacteria bacterium]|nr:phenylacetic acid degradation protein PaaY [Gammaproteobacteria bacterium]